MRSVLVLSLVALLGLGCSNEKQPDDNPDPVAGPQAEFAESYAGTWTQADGATFAVVDGDEGGVEGTLQQDPLGRWESAEFTLARESNGFVGTCRFVTLESSLSGEVRWELTPTADGDAEGRVQAAFIDGDEVLTFDANPMWDEHEFDVSRDGEPAETTDDPVDTTDDPVDTTDDPVDTTDDPVDTTDEPVDTTDEPVASTDDTGDDYGDDSGDDSGDDYGDDSGDDYGDDTADSGDDMGDDTGGDDTADAGDDSGDDSTADSGGGDPWADATGGVAGSVPVPGSDDSGDDYSDDTADTGDDTADTGGDDYGDDTADAGDDSGDDTADAGDDMGDDTGGDDTADSGDDSGDDTGGDDTADSDDPWADSTGGASSDSGDDTADTGDDSGDDSGDDYGDDTADTGDDSGDDMGDDTADTGDDYGDDTGDDSGDDTGGDDPDDPFALEPEDLETEVSEEARELAEAQRKAEAEESERLAKIRELCKTPKGLCEQVFKALKEEDGVLYTACWINREDARFLAREEAQSLMTRATSARSMLWRQAAKGQLGKLNSFSSIDGEPESSRIRGYDEVLDGRLVFTVAGGENASLQIVRLAQVEDKSWKIVKITR